MPVALTMTQLFGLVGSVAAFMALGASRHRPVTENVGLAMVAHHVVVGHVLWWYALPMLSWVPGARIVEVMGSWPRWFSGFGVVALLVLVGLLVRVARSERYERRQKVAFGIAALLIAGGVAMTVRIPFALEALLVP